MKLNICIVGYGAIGPVHANAIKKIKNVTLYAVCDINDSRARQCADEYNCIVYNDFEEMLKDCNIDVVHICTPHYLHKDMTIKALKSGKDVVLEKPVAINKNEMDELVAFVNSDENKKKLCVMLQNRRNVCIEKLKEIVLNNDLGKLKGIIGNVFWKRDEAYYNQDEWRGKWATEGGGLLINQTVHMIDMMLYFGGKVEDFKASINHWHISNIEVEDNAQVLMYFENGARGIFNASNCYVVDEPYILDLLFEKAHYRYADNCLYKIGEKGAEYITSDKSVKVGKSYWGSGHLTVISSFYDSLNGNGEHYTDINDAYDTMKLVFDIYDNVEWRNNG